MSALGVSSWALPAVLAVVLLAAYVKFAVVLEVLRGALAGIPPRSVSALLALLLTVFVMAPVASQAWHAAEPELQKKDAGSDPALAAANAAMGPLAEFLDRHAPERERRSFLDLARRLRPPEARDAVAPHDLIVTAPAFVTAELKAAFTVGFLLFLPFLVLELVTAALLSALGLHALDPRLVSLPFKLLLFVAADGWHLLARGLVLGYT